MQKKPLLLPSDKAPLDAMGFVKTTWFAFLKGLEKTPAAELPDLPPSATLAQTIADQNAIKKILRDNGLLDT